jgi:osmotically-inducible protein OsmY
VGQLKSDSRIQQEVLQELKWDSRIDATKIGVTVDQGVVTLTGTVGSFTEKWAAQEAAHRVTGVLDVANDLRVKTMEANARTDTEIAQAVRQALAWDVLVPDERIRSTVSDGWVTLEGSVDLLREREDAQRAVRHLTGVRGINNKIVVSPLTRIDPAEVQNMIEEALKRRAARDADRIQVVVRDGEVTLSGRVRSWAEKEAIIDSVSLAPGVQTINNHLLVEADIVSASG